MRVDDNEDVIMLRISNFENSKISIFVDELDDNRKKTLNKDLQTWNFLKFNTSYFLIFLFSYFYVNELNLNRLNFWKK
jgi:hypothetical protein